MQNMEGFTPKGLFDDPLCGYKGIGNMMVQTERPFYGPGEQVNGKVFLQIGTPVDAKSLTISIKGKEKSKFRRIYHEHKTEEGPDGQPHTVVERKVAKHKSEKEVFEGKAKLADFGGSELQPGNYEALFYFKLPDKCPSSFYFEDKHTENKPMMKTKYAIKAKLDLKEEDDFKYKTTLMIREPNEKAKEDVDKKDRDHLKTWCCLD